MFGRMMNNSIKSTTETVFQIRSYNNYCCNLLNVASISCFIGIYVNTSLWAICACNIVASFNVVFHSKIHMKYVVWRNIRFFIEESDNKQTSSGRNIHQL